MSSSIDFINLLVSRIIAKSKKSVEFSNLQKENQHLTLALEQSARENKDQVSIQTT